MVFNSFHLSPNPFYENYRTLWKRTALMSLSQIEKLLFGNRLEVGQTPSEVISEIEKVKAYFTWIDHNNHSLVKVSLSSQIIPTVKPPETGPGFKLDFSYDFL